MTTQEKDFIIDAINKLSITYMPVNAWVDKKYKPYTVKLVSLDDVLNIMRLIKKLELE